MIEGLAEHDILPLVFYEGIWDKRMGPSRRFPPAKSLGWFQFSDIFKVKEVVGDTMAIIGGYPETLLQAGTRRGGPRDDEAHLRGRRRRGAGS